MSQDKPTYQQLQQRLAQLENLLTKLYADQTDPPPDNQEEFLPWLKQAHTQLYREKETARKHLDIAAVMLLVLDANANVKHINIKGTEILEYDEKDIVGKNWIDNFVPRPMRNDVWAIFNHIMTQGGQSYDKVEDHAVLTKNGEEKLIAWRNVALTDHHGNFVGTLSSGEDVTERKQAERQLRTERNFSQSLIETAQTIMLILDPQGRIVSFNPYMADICGYRLDEVKGADWFETFLPKEDQQRIRKLFKQAIGDIQTCGNVNPIVTKDGRLRQIEWYDKTLKDTHGNITGLLSVGQDITERIAAEQELQHAQKLAEAANQAKTSFLANMSHEIRTPMNAIVGFSDILATEELTPQQKEYVDIIHDAGQNLLSIIDDILDISKIEAGKLDIEITECSVSELLNSVDALLRPQACAKGLDFRVSSQPDVPPVIRTDPLRLSQCLTNLINNAIKFTDSGHVHLTVSLAPDQDEPHLRFDVEDTGIGIALEHQDLVFESFSQADSSTTRKFGGTGLGLTITRKLASKLRGKVTLQSQPGAGSVFSLFIPTGVTLPAQPKPEQSNAPHYTDKDFDPLHPHFTGNILVAEDDPSNQHLIDILLKKMGLTVTLVNTGRQAIDAAGAQTFDLIFMDMQMPDIDGYQATRTLRRTGLTVPIVALTGHAMEQDHKLCLEVGCDHHLPKPFSRDELLEVLANYLPSAKPADSLA